MVNNEGAKFYYYNYNSNNYNYSYAYKLVCYRINMSSILDVVRLQHFN